MKRFLKPALVALLSVVAVELGAGYIYFQRSWEQGVASLWLFERLFDARGYAGGTDTGNTAAAVTWSEYRAMFGGLVHAARQRSVAVAMLYIPRSSDGQPSARPFFEAVARDSGVRFLDATDELGAFAEDAVFNLPADRHLSRFGHRLVARYLERELRRPRPGGGPSDARSGVSAAVGPHPAGVDQLRLYAGRGYRVQTNAQGFRMSRPVHDDPDKTTILVLGDSFTFGTGVDTADAYPDVLNARLGHSQVINAGVPGAGIAEASRVFRRFLATARPDLVIVQVLDNDLVRQPDIFLKESIERVQTGLRLDKRLLEGLTEHLDMSGGDLIEGMTLHSFALTNTREQQ